MPHNIEIHLSSDHTPRAVPPHQSAAHPRGRINPPTPPCPARVLPPPLQLPRPPQRCKPQTQSHHSPRNAARHALPATLLLPMAASTPRSATSHSSPAPRPCQENCSPPRVPSPNTPLPVISSGPSQGDLLKRTPPH